MPKIDPEPYTIRHIPPLSSGSLSVNFSFPSKFTGATGAIATTTVDINKIIGSMNNYQFDFGMGSSRNKPLNEQKNPSTSSFSSYSSSAAQSKPSWQSNKPSWTHQPAPMQTSRPGLNGPSSMVGDISGKSWNSFAPSGGGSTIGIVNKDPSLFGDLVGSAMGVKGSMNSNVPLKNVAPKTNSSSKSPSPYSMGNLADSLPKRTDQLKSSGNWGSTGGYNDVGVNVNVSSNRDPFGSLLDFSSKQSSSTTNSGSKAGNKAAADSFGDFQHASKPNTKPSTTSFQSSGFPSNSNNFMGSNANAGFDMGDFGMPAKNVGSQSQKPVNSSGGDPLDMFFSSSSASSGGVKTASGGVGEQQFSGDDWGMEPDFGTGGIDEGGSTTELEGLPPPPAGVSAASAKSKGVDNKNQGQYADAIKWLSWAVILLEKAGDKAGTADALSCRASCYKEVGEYKKAVADCSKVLENDKANVSVLVQRALLYESMEKYRLGAEDLRAVLKIDPANRVARSTVHRLVKMAD